MKYLNVSSNPITNKGGMRIAELLQQESNKISKLIISNVKLSSDTFLMIGKSIPRGILKHLDVSNNPQIGTKIDKNGIDEFCKFIENKSCNLSYLNLSGINMDSNFLISLSKVKNRSIKSLIISSNCITNVSVLIILIIKKGKW